MRILGRFFGRRRPSVGDLAYDAAVQVNDDLIARMRASSDSPDAFRAMMADLWAQRHNMELVTTVYEVAQEMKVATPDYQRERPDDSSS